MTNNTETQRHRGTWSFGFDILSDRASILPKEPNRKVIHWGGSLGGSTPRVFASESKKSRWVTC